MPLGTELVELELLADLFGGERSFDVLLVGKHEERSTSKTLRKEVKHLRSRVMTQIEEDDGKDHQVEALEKEVKQLREQVHHYDQYDIAALQAEVTRLREETKKLRNERDGLERAEARAHALEEEVCRIVPFNLVN